MKFRPFHFKRFSVRQEQSVHKVGTDGVLLGAWAGLQPGDRSLLDIGTGTGLIALMLAQRTGPDVLIDAVEIGEADAGEAKENVRRSPWNDRISVHHTAVQNFTPGKRYDLIVTNPPYFVNSLLPPDQRRSAARHSDDLSFDDLLKNATRLLSSRGRFALILPVSEGRHFANLAPAFGLALIRETSFRTRRHKDLERLLLEFGQTKGTVTTTDELVLYGEGEQWSDQYKNLTRDFYLKG